jgi:hypothetical protein
MSIQNLVEEIKQATEVNQNRLRLREQIIGDLLVTHNDGLFQVTTDLISFLSCWPDDTVYLQDHYGNPVCCDRQQLLQQCQQQYTKVMNRWHHQHEQLKRIRKV